LDYFETYAPVARLATSRIVYALVGLLDLAMASVDVEAASVNVTLKEELHRCP